MIIKFIWKGKKHRIDNTTLKKNTVGELTLLDFKTYYKVTIFETVWYWCIGRKKKKKTS